MLTLSKYKQRNWVVCGNESLTSGDVEIYVLRYASVPPVKEFALAISDEVRTYFGILLACIKKKDKRSAKAVGLSAFQQTSRCHKRNRVRRYKSHQRGCKSRHCMVPLETVDITCL